MRSEVQLGAIQRVTRAADEAGGEGPRGALQDAISPPGIVSTPRGAGASNRPDAAKPPDLSGGGEGSTPLVDAPTFPSPRVKRPIATARAACAPEYVRRVPARRRMFDSAFVDVLFSYVRYEPNVFPSIRFRIRTSS